MPFLLAASLGIFATMGPALDDLQLHAAQLGISTPWHFYWCAGALSSVLDNAPTYLTSPNPCRTSGLRGGRQLGCRLFRRRHLYRQWAEFDDQSHSRPSPGRAARFLHISTDPACRCCCSFWRWRAGWASVI